jgi:hypothetical protein
MEEMRDETMRQAQVAQARVTKVINEDNPDARRDARRAARNARKIPAKVNGICSKFSDDILCSDANSVILAELGVRMREEVEVWVEVAKSAAGAVRVICNCNEDARADRAKTAVEETKEEAEVARDNAQKARDETLWAMEWTMANTRNRILTAITLKREAWKARAEANRARDAARVVNRALLSHDCDGIVKKMDDAAREAGEFADEAEKLAGLKK